MFCNKHYLVRWEDEVCKDLRELNADDWHQMAQDRPRMATLIIGGQDSLWLCHSTVKNMADFEEKSPEEKQELVKQFKEWLYTQPQLPNDIEDRMLRRFLHGCYYDLEKAKACFKLFISLRAACPELLKDRDPLSPQVQKMFTFLKQAQLKISGNRKLWIWKLEDPGLQNFDSFQDAKMFFITTDLWLLTDDFMEEADVIISDTRDIISLKFLYSKFSFFLARKMLKYQQEALPIRLKEIHIVNAPPFIDKFFGWLKPFLKKEIAEMMHFHAPDSDTLYNYISKEDLPENYGGTRGKIDDYMKEIIERLVSKREYFIDNDLWKAGKEDKTKNKVDVPKSAPVGALEIN